MKQLLNRVCWNTSGWQRPTGSTSDSGYPGKNGFGHEEWNFRLEDAFEGYIYGYLYFKPADKILKKSNNFKIGFWTFNQDTKEKILVGVYNQAEYIRNDDLEYKKLDSYFKKNNIYKRRTEELLTANPKIGYERAKKEVLYLVQKKGLSFKCPVNEVITFDINDNIVLPEKVDGKNISHRFSTPVYINSLEELIDSVDQSEYSQVPLVEDGYYREVSENLLHIKQKHNILSNELANWLSKNGYKNIVQEENRVDIECIDSDNNSCRIEIKVTSGVSTTKAIREALGQLLEYNHYGIRKSVDKWMIVLDKKPSADDIKFLKNLKTLYNMPLEIGWSLNELFTFESL